MNKADILNWNKNIQNPKINGHNIYTEYQANQFAEAYHQSEVKNKILMAYNSGALAVSQGRFMTEGNSAEDYYKKLLKK